MAVKSLADLKKMSSEFKNTVSLRENGDNVDSLIQIKVAMATCGIASGAKEVMDFYLEELDKQGIKAVVTQTGCMGYCYAEPTIEVKLPGKDPIVFGHVNVEKASEILEKYIKNGELVEGIIPVNYETVK
ncbi:(2Fe-2S) ferredoxin domain-containing protein [bacterium]|jgi:NADP-reducing hydrogenase subunit HndB|nr:(2Fe-2S) ferredoxin domain-containing protein [bacterium]MBO7127070.1 (2Fe-2S) ferredoxin domain-containing protein [bacterium]MBP5406228.1 (2Fe-2S) ferredoxin domain-containing protein [bacterium]MBP5591158.1 (2Fe-2S) ferredoxin domain-containing protein [bacterium]MBQ3368406.1 (2Fe-2S) ferredoxin domain-containing protein [bacterium]